MTGTAKSAAAEFYEIYGLRVVPIPTNKPPRRQDLPLRLYYTEKVRRQKLVKRHAALLAFAASHWPQGAGTSAAGNESLHATS